METFIKTSIVALCETRAPKGSLCPSEVARALWPLDWREHMAEVRAAGVELAKASQIEITQGGAICDPGSDIRGAIRYRLPL
jgi:hypothetical protein